MAVHLLGGGQGTDLGRKAGGGEVAPALMAVQSTRHATQAVRAPGTDATPRKSRAVGQHLLVLAGYAILAVALTWPVASRLFTEVPGGGDAWQHIWNLWWVKQALLVEHTSPYHTDLLYYPEGVSLYFHTLVLTAGLVGIPLQLLGFNLIATYNLVLLSTFVLAGYGMYLLCMYLTRHAWASFVGGIVFAFSPYHLAHTSGHMNLASLQWLPFYVLALLKAFEPGAVWDRRTNRTEGDQLADAPVHGTARERLLWSVAAGALLALNAYTDWLYLIFLVLFTGLFAAWKLLIPSERRGLGVGMWSWMEAGTRFAIMGLVFLVLSAPIFFPTLAEATRGYAQQPPFEVLVYSSDLTSAVTPSELHPVWGAAIKEQVNNTGPYLPIKNPSERVLFLGFSVLVLAALGLWRGWRSMQVRFWAFAAFTTWLLSLGPLLQYMGKTTFTLFEVNVPLPYLLLYRLPLLSIMRTPARLTVLTMLALGVLAAFALTALLGRRYLERGRVLSFRNAVWGLLLPAIIVFEFLAVPFPTVPPGWNVPIYRQIATEPGDFALLELPIRPFGDYMAYQTVHGKPIVGGYLSRQPPYATLAQTPALHYLEDTVAADDPVSAQVTEGRGVTELKALGVKYVIIRWWAFTPEQKQAMQVKLDNLLARPPDYSYPSDTVDVWELK
ncbi:MAG TPA: hypothetical protein VF826_14915 [Chloroflexia bacterium]